MNSRYSRFDERVLRLLNGIAERRYLSTAIRAESAFCYDASR